jgi:hypothetical protein
VASLDAVQLSDTDALLAVAARPIGAEGIAGSGVAEASAESVRRFRLC